MLAVVVVKFFQEFAHLSGMIVGADESKLILAALRWSISCWSRTGREGDQLGLRELRPRLDVDNARGQLSWLGKLDSGSIKIMIASSIVADLRRIPCCARSSTRPDPQRQADPLVVVHLTFVVSALQLAIIDRLASGGHVGLAKIRRERGYPRGGAGRRCRHDRPARHRARPDQPDRRRHRRQSRASAPRPRRRRGRRSRRLPELLRRRLSARGPGAQARLPRRLPRGGRAARRRHRGRRPGDDRGRAVAENGKVYNAALLLEGGRVVARRATSTTCRTTACSTRSGCSPPGPLPGPVRLPRASRLGVMVCEDMWTPDVAEDLAESGRRDPDRAQRLALRAATSTTSACSSPWRACTETGLPLIYVNQVGGQDELVFDGASFVLNADRRSRRRRRPSTRTVALTRWQRGGDGAGRCRARRDRAPPPERLEAIYRAMVLGLRDYVDKNRFPGVVLGLSGGIDSALSAAVAVDALGRRRGCAR